MTFLPIVERELRVGARRASTYWWRCVAAGAALLVWLLLVWINQRLSTAQLSRLLFTAFAVLAFGVCLLAGVFLTADCLSEEKREGTMGLLFLTDLKGYDVVLGKLFATSLRAVFGLLAIVPILALPLLMGGVTVGEFWRVVLVLLASVLLSLSLGMAVSATQTDSRQAMGGTLLGLLLLSGGLPALWWMHALFSRGPHLDALLLPSPPYLLQCAFDWAYRLRSGGHAFWVSLQMVLASGVLLLAFAAVLLPRRWQAQQEGNQVLDLSALPPGSKRLAELAKKNSRDAARARALQQNPFLWLVCRTPLLGGPANALLLLLILFWVIFFQASLWLHRFNYAFVVCLFLSYALHQFFKYAVALDATRRFSEDRRSGALELLLVSPVPEKDLIAGQERGLRRRFGPLLRLVMGLNLALSGAVLFSSNLGMNETDQAIFLELFLGGALIAWVDFRALGIVGIATSLKYPRHHRAVLATLGRVLLPPWGAVFALVFVLQSVSMSPEGFATVFASWFVLGLVTDILVSQRARATVNLGLRNLLNPEPEKFPTPTEAPVRALQPNRA